MNDDDDDDNGNAVQTAVMPLPDYLVCARDTFPFHAKGALGLVSNAMETAATGFYSETQAYGSYTEAFEALIDLMRSQIETFFDDVYCPLTDPERLKQDMPVLVNQQEQSFRLEELIEFQQFDSTMTTVSAAEAMDTGAIKFACATDVRNSNYLIVTAMYQARLKHTAHPMLVKTLYDQIGMSGRLDRAWPRYYIEARTQPFY